ncbi:hypothetical protein CAter282_1098 [Collimonas arenae]|uniref:Uncharacterized protein n=1 Tax=Collimonas arenae TaxID=279058 RepID=A0A127PML3_9BURK|nr:hypothetical protein CAter10_1188 [Collimonas arenae]AMP08893.1 hypothetical protein CAter282_1098 [Collimonas arenae]
MHFSLPKMRVLVVGLKQRLDEDFFVGTSDSKRLIIFKISPILTSLPAQVFATTIMAGRT